MTNVARLHYDGGHEWQWQQLGACRGVEEARFFHPENERGSDRERREAGAKRVCAGCEVLERCREHALAVREPYGVWGGLGEGERRHILTERRRLGPRTLGGDD
ncbi:WhiB family transcriptional regulator [Rhodococcus aerolatus]